MSSINDALKQVNPSNCRYLTVFHSSHLLWVLRIETLDKARKGVGKASYTYMHVPAKRKCSCNFIQACMAQPPCELLYTLVRTCSARLLLT